MITRSPPSPSGVGTAKRPVTLECYARVLRWCYGTAPSVTVPLGQISAENGVFALPRLWPAACFSPPTERTTMRHGAKKDGTVMKLNGKMMVVVAMMVGSLGAAG